MDDVERVDDVAAGLGHLVALCVGHQPVQLHGLRRVERAKGGFSDTYLRAIVTLEIIYEDDIINFNVRYVRHTG